MFSEIMKPYPTRIAERLIPALAQLRQEALALENAHRDLVDAAHPEYRDSARNLLHYLAMRQSDIRNLQNDLALIGLSRLGHAEAHVMCSFDAVSTALHALTGRAPEATEPPPVVVPMGEGSGRLNLHADTLLGRPAGKRATRIMVTMPSEAAGDPHLLEELLKAGMDVMRINCAHDDPDAWLAMIGNLRQAQRATGRTCRIYADLAGPKLRTGRIEPIGRMLDFKPRRDAFGRVLAPARVWLTPRAAPQPPQVEGVAVLPLDDALLQQARAGDYVNVDDARGGRRHLCLEARHGQSWLASCPQHAYLMDGAECALYRGEKRVAAGTAGPLPEVMQPLLLKVGDTLLLTAADQPGRIATYGEQGELLRPASIPCSLDAVFDAARPGQPVWFDDGKIGGRIVENANRCLRIEITHAAPLGSKLRAEKGINLPQTELAIPALTDQDRDNLRILAPHIDVIGMSFVRSAADVLDLQAQLGEIGANRIGTVLKIETRHAFENLPLILLAALRQPPVGVMVARGDLAVEIGFERLAEVQEEILWLCEAAHVPVIWATQVLDTMARRGMPTRAEVSDAAKGIRAECVMLNKGPYIAETVRFLCGVLERMSDHQSKHQPMMRRLAVSRMPGDPQRTVNE
jgi:pyruvate kinase